MDSAIDDESLDVARREWRGAGSARSALAPPSWTSSYRRSRGASVVDEDSMIEEMMRRQAHSGGGSGGAGVVDGTLPMDDALGGPSKELQLLETLLKSGIVKERYDGLHRYPACFPGNDAVRLWVRARLAPSVEDALLLGGDMLRRGCIEHVLGQYDFENTPRFYRIVRQRVEHEIFQTPAEVQAQDLALVRSLVENDLIKDRRFHFKIYRQCFVGRHAVKVWLKEGMVSSRKEAMDAGRRLIRHGVIKHVCDHHHFKDDYLFYRIIDMRDVEGYGGSGSSLLYKTLTAIKVLSTEKDNIGDVAVAPIISVKPSRSSSRRDKESSNGSRSPNSATSPSMVFQSSSSMQRLGSSPRAKRLQEYDDYSDDLSIDDEL